MGRTGVWWAHTLFDPDVNKPDLMVFAKVWMQGARRCPSWAGDGLVLSACSRLVTKLRPILCHPPPVSPLSTTPAAVFASLKPTQTPCSQPPRAQGIASGYPLAGVAGRSELMDRLAPGTLGGTYGGNAVACAAAVATINVSGATRPPPPQPPKSAALLLAHQMRVPNEPPCPSTSPPLHSSSSKAIEEDRMMANVAARSAQLMRGLVLLTKKYPIVDVRGRGLMVGVEFGAADGGRKAEKGVALVSRASSRGGTRLAFGLLDLPRRLQLLPAVVAAIKSSTQQSSTRHQRMSHSSTSPLLVSRSERSVSGPASSNW